MIRRLRPTSGRLLVRIEHDPEESTPLIAPPLGFGAERRRMRRGVVVARPRSDDDEKRPETPVRVGDVVLFPAGCGQGLRLRINGHEHALVREQDVLATVDD
jgi:co-chaperonin GroES (HSP10)